MITLQVGSYSNAVGAHLFNLQNPETQSSEECRPPTTLWRDVKEGTRRGVKPRLMAFDTMVAKRVATRPALKISSPRSKGVPEGSSSSASVWHGAVDNLIDEEEEQTDTSTASWGNVATWKLPADKILSVPNLSHNQETNHLATYAQGLEIYDLLREETEDGVRKYAEECDLLEGFIIMADQLDGFSGIAGGLLPDLADEYEKKFLFGITLCPPTLPEPHPPEPGKGRSFRTRISNTVLLWNAMNSHSSVFTSLGLCENFCSPKIIPKKLPYLQYNADVHYESSAILAAAIDTLITPSISLVSGSPPMSFSELGQFIAGMGRNMCSVSASFPFPLQFAKGFSLYHSLKNNGLNSVSNLTPGMVFDLEKCAANYFSIRGVPEDVVTSTLEQRELINAGKSVKNTQECLELFTTESYPNSVNLVKQVNRPFAITQPFPCSVLTDSAREQFASARKYSQGVVSSWSLSSLSGAHNSIACGSLVDQVIRESGGKRGLSGKIAGGLQAANELGIDEDEFLDALNKLHDLKNAYDVDSLDADSD